MTKLEMRLWRAALNALYHLTEVSLEIKALIRNPGYRFGQPLDPVPVFTELSGLSQELTREIDQ